jgi:hypothetical protein
VRHPRLPRRHPTPAPMDLADLFAVFSINVVEVMTICEQCKNPAPGGWLFLVREWDWEPWQRWCGLCLSVEVMRLWKRLSDFT